MFSLYIMFALKGESQRAGVMHCDPAKPCFVSCIGPAGVARARGPHQGMTLSLELLQMTIRAHAVALDELLLS